MNIIFNGVIAVLFVVGHTSQGLRYEIPNEQAEKDNDYWYKLGKEDIDDAINKENIKSVAKNVILFLGDGMGITFTTAARIYKGQKNSVSGEEGFLIWEKFNNLAQIKTYNIDKQVADSAGTATAYLGGVKANYYTLGVNGHCKAKDCKCSLEEKNRVSSIMKWSQESGKETGFITSARVTHATPAALYAHSSYRYWESDLTLNKDEDTQSCKDIARQLVEDEPGKNVKVIFGGGRQQMGSPIPGDDGEGYRRNDSRNLVNEWLEEKEARNASAKYVTNNKEFRELDLENTDFILGLFGGGHMPYSYSRDDGPKGTPTLKELTETAIKRLKKSDTGYFLMVEGGRIDHGLHDTKAHVALEELLDFERAVEAAVKMTDEEDTLIIVTADHSHVITMNGYPERGNDILGITKYEEGIRDDMPHTTLMFTNGFGANYTWNGEEVMRRNMSGIDTRDFDFIQQAAVPMKEGYETHGGEDVAAYARGPYAHLFHRVHDQSYVAHVMGYASCVGPYAEKCARKNTDGMKDRGTKAYKIVKKNLQKTYEKGTSSTIGSSSMLLLLPCIIAFTIL